MPKVTIWPARAATTARSSAACRAGRSVIAASAAISQSTASGRLGMQQQGGGGDGGGAVAADRLQQDAGAVEPGLAQLLGDQEAVRLVADHQRGAEGRAAGPAGGLLQHGLGGDQRPELLRVALPRQRPETGARATRKDHRNDHCEPVLCLLQARLQEADAGDNRASLRRNNGKISRPARPPGRVPAAARPRHRRSGRAIAAGSGAAGRSVRRSCGARRAADPGRPPAAPAP